MATCGLGLLIFGFVLFGPRLAPVTSILNGLANAAMERAMVESASTSVADPSTVTLAASGIVIAVPPTAPKTAEQRLADKRFQCSIKEPGVICTDGPFAPVAGNAQS